MGERTDGHAGTHRTSTLDTLRPYIASHRGQVEVVDFDEADGRCWCASAGTCHGCAASTITLRQGIEARLREIGARSEAGAGRLEDFA